MHERDAARFWAKVEKTGGCWLWTAALSDRGYGRFALDGKNRHAHRIAYELTFGTILDGLFVCHSCDNRRCVNPAHLWLGTLAENNADRDAKGRHGDTAARGERSGHSKLTEQDVLTIRQLAAEGVRHRAIARRYGVNPSQISLIVRRINWKHI
jgi:hypothetical protein